MIYAPAYAYSKSSLLPIPAVDNGHFPPDVRASVFHNLVSMTMSMAVIVSMTVTVMLVRVACHFSTKPNDDTTAVVYCVSCRCVVEPFLFKEAQKKR